MSYRCAASSLKGFVQQIAVGYAARGYVHYVQGRVPEGKARGSVDQKLVGKYGVAVSKWRRRTRRAKGLANVQYLRWESNWVLMATEGAHECFFLDEGANVRDLRVTPLRIGGYAISRRGEHAHVRIDQGVYRVEKRRLLALATMRTRREVEDEFRQIPYEPYAPVRRQLLAIWRAVNKKRGSLGFRPVRKSCLRLRRISVKVFEGDAGADES